MTTTITRQVLADGHHRTLIKYVGLLDSNVTYNTLVDVGSLNYALNANSYIMVSPNANGYSVATSTDRKSKYSVMIERIQGQAHFPSGGHVTLSWANSNTNIVTIGSGMFDYNFETQGNMGNIPVDGANATGNINISTVGVGSGDVMTLFISIHKSGSDYDQGEREDPAAFNYGG